MSTDIRFIAKQYIDAGWSVVPLVKGEKRASDSWQKKTYEPKHFGADDGIALKCGEPSGHRVDVDLDCIEAIAAARELLPKTQLVHGRPSKPSSHHWFVCPDIKTKQFTDVKAQGAGIGPMLVELRSTGGYTAVPPSMNPSGETLTWEIQGSPMPIEPDVLKECVRDIAIVSLLARHWHNYGHAAIGPLAGFLCQGGLVPDHIVFMVELIAKIAGAPSDTVKDAVNYAQTTVGKFKSGDKVTGGPTLEEHLGENIVAKMRGWLKLADVDAIEEMNAKHFFTTLGTKSVIGREDKLDGIDAQVIFQRPNELTSEYKNRKIVVGETAKGKPEVKPLFDAWLESKHRRAFSTVVFAPPPLTARDNEYNLWRDFAVEPLAQRDITSAEVEAYWRGEYVPGRCFRILRHFRQVIANNDPLYYEAFLNWVAHMVQRPGEVAGTAHIWISEEGTGKNLGAEAISKLFHPSLVFSGASDLVVGKFNACTRNRIFFNVNESDGKKLRKNIDRLKMIITEPVTYLESKGVDPYAIKNFAHVLFTTNGDEEGNVDLPSHVGQRRLVFQQVSNRYAFGRCTDAERRAYFGPLMAELKDERSLGAFLWFLQQRDLTDYDPYAKLVTDEEARQRNLGLKGPMRWLWDLVALGQMPVMPPNVFTGANPDEVLVSAVYQQYIEWAKNHHETPVGPGPWGKAVNAFLWERTGRTNTERFGVLVSIDELEKRLRAVSDAQSPLTELLWSDGTLTTFQE